ncbi:hypothetical protein Gotur_025642, partial [Gossypium turneri]
MAPLGTAVPASDILVVCGWLTTVVLQWLSSGRS